MYRFILILILGVICMMPAAETYGEKTENIEQLKERIKSISKDFKDISFIGVVTYKNKDAVSKVEPKYAQMYEFKSANIYIKMPDKMRMEGKLGMVKFEYIINGTTKIFRAPKLGIRRKDDYAKDPAKLQDPLDLGIVTDTIWKNRDVSIVTDDESKNNGEIKLKLRWRKGDMYYYAWLDEKELFLKRFEKYDANDAMKVRTTYSEHEKVSNVIWVPKKVEVFAPDGDKAGASEYTNIRVNTNIPDELFK